MKEKLGRPIYNLQTMLRMLSQSDSRILPVIPDGVYGANTYASVRSYQEIYGLPASGTVNLDTWSSIVNQYNAVLLSIYPSDGMHLAQAMLAAISEQYPEIEAPPVTGKNNTNTKAGLQFIQTAADLPPSGMLTAETQRALQALYLSVT